MDNKEQRKIKYNKYIDQVKNIALAMTKDKDQAFIWPDYKYMLTKENLSPDRCELELSWDDIYRILELEVEMWNKTQSRFGKFLNTLATVLNDDTINYIEHNVTRSIEDELARIRAEKNINSKAD